MARANPIFRSPLITNHLRNGATSSYFPSPNPNPKPKVVSIPVNFVGSETSKKKKIDPSIAAIKIQSVFRGFLVRSNAKFVRKIEAEVDEIERKFRSDKGMDLIVGDAKERLKVSETLMALLFRLDSVRGVRDYRKRVIRRVILMQEMLDSITECNDRKRSEDVTLEAPRDEKPDQEMADPTSAVGADDGDLEATVGLKGEWTVDAEGKTLGSDESDEEMADSISTVNGDVEATESKGELEPNAKIEETQTLEAKPDEESMVDSISTVESAERSLETGYHEAGLEADDEVKAAKTLETKPDEEMLVDAISTIESGDRNLENGDRRTGSKAEAESEEANTLGTKPDQEMVVDSISTIESVNQKLEYTEMEPEADDGEVQTLCHGGTKPEFADWELLETEGVDDLPAANQGSDVGKRGGEAGGGGDDKKTGTTKSEVEGLREVMERMVAENEKLKGLVAELCQRSVQQCSLMGGLAERVEQLEMVVKKMEKKNKKKRKESTSSPSSAVDKKSGGGSRTS